ncbi:TetR/AcrR family transcriptional regulator [Actinoplanes sp. CA-030573]|uniref:TetR/AcrR family transcriptional regulator n=1 Tax=Actinoplanes sp. CA-030573 TaxID=3239898 RepID=UPI003D8EF40C
MPSGDVEQRLITAGVELLAEAGTDALSLREIARRAGVSHGAPRRYFPTHQALLAAIARQGYRRLATVIEETIGDHAHEPRTALMMLGRRYVAFARDEPGMFALMFRHDLLRGNNIGLRQESTPLFGVLVDLLRQAHRARPTETAAALWAALHGIAQLWHWGTLQVVTGFDTPEPLLEAAVDAHLGA